MKKLILCNIILLSNCNNECLYNSICNNNGIEGVCLSISNNCCNGQITSGLCSGSNDIKCCTENKCSTIYGNGTCILKSQCKTQSISGYCIGPSDLQCCLDDDSNNNNDNDNNDNNIQFGDNPYYYTNWCDSSSSSLQYLDDKYCEKKFPSLYNREWKCPLQYDNEYLNNYSYDLPLNEVNVDITTLTNIVNPNDANICLIVTRRQNDGKLTNKY